MSYSFVYVVALMDFPQYREEKMATRNPGDKKRASHPPGFRVAILFWWFIYGLSRRTKRKWDYS